MRKECEKMRIFKGFRYPKTSVEVYLMFSKMKKKKKKTLFSFSSRLLSPILHDRPIWVYFECPSSCLALFKETELVWHLKVGKNVFRRNLDLSNSC